MLHVPVALPAHVLPPPLLQRHGALLAELNTNVGVFGRDLAHWNAIGRTNVLAVLLHAADISNCVKPRHLCLEWAHRVNTGTCGESLHDGRGIQGEEGGKGGGRGGRGGAGHGQGVAGGRGTMLLITAPLPSNSLQSGCMSLDGQHVLAHLLLLV